MSNTSFFSIITPVYNASQYLNECIESVIGQSFVDWQLILIDDGSTDDSPAICDKYAAYDDRVVVIHKQNAGAFIARMTGINIATGQYYLGLDADDKLTIDCLQKIYEAIEESGCDLISYSRSILGDESDVSLPLLPAGKKHSGKEFLHQIIKKRRPSPWDKAIRMECVKRADYSEAPADICISLDSLSIIPALCEVQSVYIISDALYIYRMVENSISHSYNINKCLDLARVYEYDEKKFIKYDLYDDELKRLLYVDFLKNVLNRGVSPYKRREITKEDLAKARESSFYKRAKSYEKFSNFSLMDLRKLWSLRNGVWWLI